MTLSLGDKKTAISANIVKLTTSFTYELEHLPVYNIRQFFPELTEFQWNMLMSMLALGIRKQPFANPYYWQTHQRRSFARWIESYKV